MKYCSNCGAELSYKIPAGDNRRRYVCGACKIIHYQNPKIVAGCIPEWEDKILLCRRAIEPRYGLWTVPAGFMENGETVVQAAARETREETHAEVEITSLYSVFSLPHISQVYMFFRGRLRTLNFGRSAESLEVRLFGEEDIPWDALAFRVVDETLQHYFRDCAQGTYTLHVGSIEAPVPMASPPRRDAP